LAPAAGAQLTEPAAPADLSSPNNPNAPNPLQVPLPESQREITDATNTVTAIPNAGQYVPLTALFKYRNENIDYRKDAKTEPSTFSPLCSFSGTLVLRGGGCKMTFGWYNAVMSGGAPPADNQIYPLIPSTDMTVYGGVAFTPLATDPLPAPSNGHWVLKTFTAQDIRNDPNYQGGEIGFALVKGDQCTQTKYSQRALNQQCTSCTPKDPFITTVVYKGTVEDNAYYMAFEDLPVDPTSFLANNDGDFNDFVFYITGLVCAGGGQACDTGMQGACAIGKTDCSEDGKPGVCRQVIKPTTETCDNVDNDCNGKVDDGDLCPAGKVCDHGSCVAACNTGEFRCPIGLDCDAGFCVDPKCKGVMCDMGKACRAGTCVGACDGVTCPTGQECQLGHCVDLCAGVTCLDKQVCEGGLCVAPCGCRACGAGKACGMDGKCVDTGCENKMCAAGQVCTAGNCTDPCAGAVCPGGATCANGACNAPMVMSDQSGSGGSDTGSGGNPVLVLGGTDSVGGTGGAPVAVGGSATTGATNNDQPPSILKSGEATPGCSCRAAGLESSHAGSNAPLSSRCAWLGAVALGALALRRRRAA
jgi:MYXO-CTERM domain-containing protein